MIIHECDQNSDAWARLRAGRPTASEFSKLVSGTGQLSKSLPAYARTLAAELYAGRPLESWDGNQWTERGHLMEQDAADEYGLINDCEPLVVGFITDDLEQYGCSPDRLIGDSGVLEIKSLKADRHIEALQYIHKHGQIPPDYRSQAQGEIFVTEREWCDVMFFHPDLPSRTVRIEPDSEFQDKLTEQLAAVLKERDAILKFLNNEAA